MDDTTRPRLLSVDEVAEWLGIPKATIYQWRQKGYGPAGIAVGRYVRFEPGAVEAFLRAQADHPRPAA